MSPLQIHVCPTVHPIPLSHGTVGHSMECLSVPLLQMHVCPTVHPIPLSHGTVGHSMECPSVPRYRCMCVLLSVPFHSPMGLWIFHRMSILCILWNVHSPMGPWDGMDSHIYLLGDRWTFHGMSHSPMGPCDGTDILWHFLTALV